MNPPYSSQQKILATLGLLVIVAVVTTGVVYSSRSTTPGSIVLPSPSAQTAATPTPSPAATPTAAGTYKDGTYTATGAYDTPGGEETITVTFMLAHSLISSTSATSSAHNHDSARYQSQFLNSYKALVVGKSLDEVNLTRVSGSSLTSQGFKAALEQIKSQAKS